LARLDPEEGFDLLKDRVQKAVSGLFPIAGKKNTLELHDVTVRDTLSSYDTRSQKEAKLEGKSWTVPVEATVSLKDNATGKVLDRQKIRLMNLPKLTNRYSHIVDGQEYQVDNQWRLKPGVYNMVKADGALESHFNALGGGFKIHFDPATREFSMGYGNSNIPLKPLLHAMGVPEEEVEKRWGKDIAVANHSDMPKALSKFYKADTGLKPAATITPEDMRAHFWQVMDDTKLSPDVNMLTLGKAHPNVTGATLLDASDKLLKISRGEAKSDPRDALMFKDLHSMEDFAAERITQGSRDILRKIGNTVDKRDKVRDIIAPDTFNRHIRQMFSKNSLASVPSQINPLEMISAQFKTTIMGKGGIRDEHIVSDEAKLIDPSHLGFLDPIETPEGSSTGIVLRLPVGVQKKGHDVSIKMYNLHTGKNEDVNPTVAYKSHVVLPDQVKWVDGKPVPIGPSIKISGLENEIYDGSMKGADYVMRDPMQMFSFASNMIPFMPADHPNRSTMAGRQMEQAVSLLHREVPLVQSLAGAHSFDHMIGGFASHHSRVDGTVTQIKPDAVVIKDTDGKKHEVQIYDHFPLNEDKAFLHSTPIVKVGDKVSAGQTIADSNFTKGGVLAMGTNLRVGFMPYKGLNYEDGIVVTESAAKRLTSEHLHRHSIERDVAHVLDKRKFQAYIPTGMNRAQAEKLDDEGVIKPGTVVMPGDTLIAALRASNESEKREDVQLSKLHKSIVRPFKDASITWDKDYPGVVKEVVKTGTNVAVHVKTEEPLEIGDKITARHGNKGICVAIIPDHESPHTKDGRPLDVILNPLGVTGRTNLGQVLEVAAAKVAEKTGKTYFIKNFKPGADLHAQVTQDLEKHGLTDKETVYDPANGRPMGDVLVGPMHILKLHHQVEKKLSARALGYGYAYDKNKIPKGGGPHGAQSLGVLGLYAMLGHGALSNLREMNTIKSDSGQGDQFWAALQAGEMLPTPKPTFAYNKFISLIKGLNVNVEKVGNSLTLVPMTDKQVKEMSNGELKDPAKLTVAKTMRPEVGGLFDPKITGGMEGNQWAHFVLPEAFPNPVFEGAITKLTGLKSNQFDGLVAGTVGYDPVTGHIGNPQKMKGCLLGGKAFDAMLGKIDVKKDLAAALVALQKPKLKDSYLDAANKKVKFLSALDRAGLSARDAYMMKNVPVLPPSMRPLSVLPDGTISEEDLNGLYKGLHLTASRYAKMSPLIPEDDQSKVELRQEVYDGLRALSGLGGYPHGIRRGILDYISGKHIDPSTDSKVGQPKEGFFQEQLVTRKQDMTMRGTIIPEPSLSLDEVGIPKAAALELYKPFIIRELRNLLGVSPLAAQKKLSEGGEIVNRALDRVILHRPILLKRDPVLHKYGIQGLQPRIVSGKAIQVQPLITSSYNADFDGDAMGAFVPIGSDAVAEAYKMFPSNNLFSPASGRIMYSPSGESKLGLYGLTRVGAVTNHEFSTIQDVESAVRKGEVKLTDQVKVGGIHSTVGRFMVAGALPEAMRREYLEKKDPLNSSAQEELMTRIAKEHKNEYGQSINKLKDLGNMWATQTAFSVGLKDLAPEREARDRILAKADALVSKMSGPTRDAKAIEAYTKATEELNAHLKAIPEEGNNLMLLHNMGMKGGIDTIRQIRTAPMLMSNHKGEILPIPVRKSYAEGLDIAGYWTAASGGRKGVIQKVQAVQEPGHITKQVINSTMNNLILDHDCGTDKGIALSIDEKDILDRYTAADVKLGNKVVKTGTLITPELRSAFRNNNVGKVVVRSPLRCLHGPGFCQKCIGLTENGTLPEIGLNVGVLAGQALGERATQLAMKAFHGGGTAASKSSLVDQFGQVQDLLMFPKNLPGSATLSTVNGKVTKIEKDTAGGHNVIIEGERHYIPQSRGLPVYDKKPLAVGTEVKKGLPISEGRVNPHEMLPLTGLEPVQALLASNLNDMYEKEGIRRRNHEIVIKALTNLTKIKDPGSSTHFIRGDFAPTTYVSSLNRHMAKGERPIVHEPILKGVNVLPMDMQEDWMAKLNHEDLAKTVIQAAQQGWQSHIHSLHPIPAIVFAAELGKPPKEHPEWY
jgi:DNA-directed RNA polymerase subunit beta'